MFFECVDESGGSLTPNCYRPNQGSVKATSVSEYVVLYAFPPPAAITTNCFLVFVPRKVIGVACPLAGSFVHHNSYQYLCRMPGNGCHWLRR
jgi:hypothetical protein